MLALREEGEERGGVGRRRWGGRQGGREGAEGVEGRITRVEDGRVEQLVQREGRAGCEKGGGGSAEARL